MMTHYACRKLNRIFNLKYLMHQESAKAQKYNRTCITVLKVLFHKQLDFSFHRYFSYI